MFKKQILTILLVISLAGCSSVTIHPKQNIKYASHPTYEESFDFFLWGLIGEERVNVKNICQEKTATQMQSQATATDVILTILTLGIYAPHSVKVWCE